MRIIKPSEFRHIEDVRLNRGGKTIGEIVLYRGKVYYKSYRTGDHYFIKFKGFGVDAVMFMRLLDRNFVSDMLKRVGIKRKIKGIIIEYNGKREHRFYFADMDTWFLKSERYGTAKAYEPEIASFGRQFILAKKHMKVMGVAPDDWTVKKMKNGVIGGVIIKLITR